MKNLCACTVNNLPLVRKRRKSTISIGGERRANRTFGAHKSPFTTTPDPPFYACTIYIIKKNYFYGQTYSNLAH